MNGPVQHNTRMLFQYMTWADRHMLEAAATVDDAGYFRDQGISMGSIHKLLVHTMSAQWVWVSRWKGEPVARLENHEDYPTRKALAERWPAVHATLMDFVDRQDEQSLAAPLSYRNLRGEAFTFALWELMVYLVDHTTYHRGQINSMIKLAGGQPWGGSMHAFFIQQRESQQLHQQAKGQER